MANLWHDVTPDRLKPEDFIAVIEIEKGSKSKYELDKETGCYPIGEFTMLDQGKLDEKIIAIPFNDPNYNMYHDISELPDHMFREMTHFFSVYKMLEGKETVVSEPQGVEEAVKIIQKCLNAYIDKFCR